MKTPFVILAVIVSLLSACGTVGGAVSGAGKDLQKAGAWVDGVGSDKK